MRNAKSYERIRCLFVLFINIFCTYTGTRKKGAVFLIGTIPIFVETIFIWVLAHSLP